MLNTMLAANHCSMLFSTALTRLCVLCCVAHAAFKAVQRYRKDVRSIHAGGAIVGEFFSTVFDLKLHVICMIST